MKAEEIGNSVWLYRDVVDGDLCKKIISMYDEAEKDPGWRRVGDELRGGLVRVSIREEPKWKELDQELHKIVGQVLSHHYGVYGFEGSAFTDEGYGISCIEPGDSLEPHVDGPLAPDGTPRCWAFVLYLNDCPTGPLRLPRQDYTIIPEEGLIGVWPAHLSHPHQTDPAETRRFTVVTWSCLQEQGRAGGYVKRGS